MKVNQYILTQKEMVHIFILKTLYSLENSVYPDQQASDEISFFLLVSVAEETGLSLALSKTLENRF